MTTFIIAEAGVNHNGKLELAYQLIDAAVDAGADAVKFQTYKAGKIVSKKAPKAQYQISSLKYEESQYEMLKRLELKADDYFRLMEYCQSKCIEFLSSPFDIDSADFLIDKLKLQRLKLGSGEITNAPLLLHIARKGMPLILSTGMSSLGEIEHALGILAFGYTTKNESPSIEKFLQAYSSPEGQQSLNENITLLHCTTEYPAPYDQVNLLALRTLKQSFQIPVGFSDHTDGIEVSIAAVSLGAQFIEKHFTLDKSMPGPDHAASLEPLKLKQLVKSIRIIEQAMGSPRKIPTTTELKNIQIVRKSIIADKTIEAGEKFTEENLAIKRPGTGINPIYYWDYIGRVSKKNYECDEMIDED